MAITSNVHATLFDLWRARKIQSDGLRKFYEPEWRESISFYMNMLGMEMPAGAEWMRGELLPEFYIAVETVLPQLITRLYENPRSFSIEAPALTGTRTQRMIEKGVRQQRDRAQFVQRSIPHIRTGLIQGHMVIKNYWLREVGQRMVPVFGNPKLNEQGELIPGDLLEHQIVDVMDYDGPWTDFCDLHKVWKSPATDWQGRPLWLLEEIPYDVDYMRYMQRRFQQTTGENLYNEKALDSLFASQSFRSQGERGTGAPTGMVSVDAWDRSTASASSGISDQALAGTNSVRLMQCWGYVPPKGAGGRGYDDTQWRMQLFTPDGLLLRDEPSPTPDLKPPHRDIFFGRVGHEPYGRSPMRWTMTEIEQMSELRNLRLAEVWINILGTYIAARGVDWDEGDLIKYPGGVWMYDDPLNRTPDQVIQRLQKNVVLPEAYHEVADMADRIQRTSSADLNSQGMAYGGRTPATEIVNISQKHGARIDLAGALLAWQFEQVTMQDYFELDKVYLERPITVELDNETGQKVTITAQDLDFDAHISVDAGTFGSMNAMQLDALTKGLGMVMSDPEAAMHLDKRQVIEELFYRLGSQNINRILKSEEEVANEMAINQQMQMAMAALGEGQGNSGPAR